MNAPNLPPPTLDALPPPAIAHACQDAGVAKAKRDLGTLFLLGLLAGAFIALGAVAMLVVTTGASTLPFGLGRALGGIAFSLGLILVVICGAELFTGDCLMVTAWASRRIGAGALWRAWLVVYVGNLLGAMATAGLVYLAGEFRLGGGAVGKTALAVASAKLALAPDAVFFLGVLCNVLVCLAVWMSLSARSTTDKVAVIVPAVSAFVAAGFEHSIANAFFLPFALLIKAGAEPSFWTAIGQGATDFPALSVAHAVSNIAIATIGNLLGGSLLVGGVYWAIYLRKR